MTRVQQAAGLLEDKKVRTELSRQLSSPYSLVMIHSWLACMGLDSCVRMVGYGQRSASCRCH